MHSPPWKRPLMACLSSTTLLLLIHTIESYSIDHEQALIKPSQTGTECSKTTHCFHGRECEHSLFGTHTHRDTHTDTPAHTHRHTHTHRHRERDTHTHRDTQRHKHSCQLGPFTFPSRLSLSLDPSLLLPWLSMIPWQTCSCSGTCITVAVIACQRRPRSGAEIGCDVSRLWVYPTTLGSHVWVSAVRSLLSTFPSPSYYHFKGRLMLT